MKIKEKVKRIIITTSLLATNLQQKVIATSLENSQLVQGTTRLTQDFASTLRKYSGYLAIAILILLFVLRMVGDPNEAPKRDKQIKMVIFFFILILVVSSLVQVIASYYSS